MLHHRLRIQNGITDTVRYQHLLDWFSLLRRNSTESLRLSLYECSLLERSEGISITFVHLSGHWLKTPYISGTVLVPSRCPFSTQTLSGSSYPIIRCSSYCYLLHTPITNACSLLTTASLSSFKVFFLPLNPSHRPSLLEVNRSTNPANRSSLPV